MPIIADENCSEYKIIDMGDDVTIKQAEKGEV